MFKGKLKFSQKRHSLQIKSDGEKKIWVEILIFYIIFFLLVPSTASEKKQTAGKITNHFPIYISFN